MSEIWQDFAEAKEYIVDKNPVSPFIEVWHKSGKTVAVNPLVRFPKLFLPLCQEDSGLSEEEERAIENVLFHYLARMDRLSGFSLSSLRLFDIQRDIQHGLYGQRVQQWYASLAAKDQYALLWGLEQSRYEGISHYHMYRVLMQHFFTGTKVYTYEAEHRVLVHIPEEQSAEKEVTAELLQDLLLDWLWDIRLFWKWPFGILGEGQTMHIDGMVIY